MAAELAVKEQFIQLRIQGLSFSKISDQLRVSRPTLIKWSKEFSREIAQGRFLVLEGLVEQYGFAKESRLKALSEFSNKLTIELEQRNFAEIPTTQLIKILWALGDQIRKEISTVQYSEGGDLDPLVL